MLIKRKGHGEASLIGSISSLEVNPVFDSVTPAKAGVQKRVKRLDSGFRRNDTPQLPHQAQGSK